MSRHDAGRDLRVENAWLLSAVVCLVVLLIFGVAEAARGRDWLLHWFIVPLLLCGILVAEDAVRWCRGEMDVFDPVGMIGLFGFHFFFLAPLLHCRWDFWLAEVEPLRDWRPWLGGMAMLNGLGLVLYRATRRHFDSPSAECRAPVVWRLRPRRFRHVFPCALVAAAGLQLLVYMSYGGIVAYISAVEQEEHAFLGSSRIAMIAENFPILALIGYAVHLRWRRQVPSWPQLLVVLVVFGLLKMLFGGLHGSRSNILFAMFWAVGIVHFCIRPVPRKLIFAGIVGLVTFAYVYGFYKSAGVDGLRIALSSSESRSAVASEIRRPIQSTLLDDFGRSDVQAYLLYRILRDDADYQLAWGRTYAGGAITILPGPLWRNRPPTKVKEGTEALFGRDTYRPRELSSSYRSDRFVGMSARVYGLAGEAMLNFGPWGVPLVFAVFGLVVGLVRRWMVAWDPRDVRRWFLPLMVNLCLVMLIGDSDNIVALLEEDALFPLLLVMLLAVRQRRPDYGRAPIHSAAMNGAVRPQLAGGS